MSRHLPLILILIVLLFTPLSGVLAAEVPTFEGPIVPCGTEDSGDTGALDCQACDLLTLGQNIINFIVFLATVIAVLMFVYAGFLYITAFGDPGKIKQAHGIFSAVIIGFVIVLAAWLFIDLLMTTFLNKDFGPWNKILCLPTESVKYAEGGPGSGVDDVSVDTGIDPDYSFTYQPGIAAQAGDASAALNTLLACMSGKVPGNVGEISSISDSAIVSGAKTFEECAAEGSGGGICAHKKNSCHYGGSGCTGQSYAVDFGDEKNVTELSNAARECNSSAKIINEGDHIHISVGESEGCACK